MFMSIEELKEKGWENFTQEDWAYLRQNGIVNWFGPSNNIILRILLKKLAPLFKEASADIHDWNYYIWGYEEDRVKADFGFYKRIVEDVYSDENKRNLYYASLTYIYFVAVRFLGSGRYNYSK